MKMGTFPQSFRGPEQSFRAFYEGELRRVAGARLSSREVRAAYQDWAAASGATTLSFKEIAREMRTLGHRHIRSNGYRYLDVGFAADHPEAVRQAPIARTADTGLSEAIDRIDRALSDLTSLRAELCGMAANIQII